MVRAESRLMRALGVAVSIATVTLGLTAIQLPQSASALNGSEFQPGNIISDALFYDSAAMSEAEIQSFLDAKIGTCTNGACLNVLVSDVASRPREVSSTTGNVRCEAFEGGHLTAAAIIYRAQVACGISAKVILVTLQKEQGLVLKSAPSQSALDRAMGYACPDTAPCAPTTLGFGNQVYSGALQLNTYRASRFAGQPGVRAIAYSPVTSCGSSVLNIQNFATAALYNYTPYQPNAAALANLHGTGDACSSYGNRNFWVFYNDWFGPTTGGPPVALTNSAMGEPDLYGLARDQVGDLWLYSANGTGDWVSSGKVGTGWNSMTAIINAGDFNGDGNQDILARDNLGKLWMYPRDGSGGWLARVQIGSGWQGFTAIFSAGDFNGDKHQDILARDSRGNLWLYPGDGQGGWLPSVQVGSGWQVFSTIFGVGDFNGDGRPDVLAQNSAGQLWMYPSSGGGDYWQPSSKVTDDLAGYTYLLGAGDFDGDGHQDVMARDTAGLLWLFPGDGSGHISAGREIGSNWGAFSSIVIAQKPVVRVPPPPPGGAAAGDFNEDGHADVYARTSTGAVWFYPGDGTGGWLPSQQVAVRWDTFTAVFQVGDFNSDGHQDVMVRDGDGALWLYPGDGLGSWAAPVKVADGWQAFTSIFGVGDFNGDGHADVMARDSAGRLWLYPGDGTSAFLPGVQIGSGWQSYGKVFAAGDFDGDGFQDVMALDGAGRLWLYPGTGSGGLQPGAQIGSGWQIFSSIFKANDFSGDGAPDLIARTTSGYLWLYPGNGSGGWQPSVLIGSGWNTFNQIW